MKRICLLTMVMIPLLAWAGEEDDFGVWTEVGVEKLLPHDLTVGGDVEVRTQDNSTKMGRVSVGANVGYKVHKYLKVGAGYHFLEGYTPDNEGKKYYTPGYWTPRHRVSFDLSSGVKLWRLVKLSVRERYQYTYRAEQDVTRYESYVDGEGNYGYYADEPETKTRKRTDVHLLRSRLKIEFSRKHWHWTPFVSVEAQNNLQNAMHLHKVRTAAGAEYQFTKQHTLSAAYVFTCETKESPDERVHAISVGYNFKF